MTLRYIHQIILSIFAVAISALLTGCADDFPERNFGPTGEGEVTIEAAVDFRPMAGALSRAAGNSISEIDKIWVLLYSTDGNLVFSTQLDRTDVTISSENRTDSDTGTDFDRAEDKTERAKFKLTVPYGHYRMYAVANVGNIERYSNEIASEAGLKAIRFNWNNEDISANSQMFGYFSPEGETWTGSEAPIVRIDGSTRSLCAWIKRVASKVTVAFDGSKLRKGVNIYIKSVSIKDIPYSSQLGEGNAVKSTDSPLYAPVHSSQTIVYGEGSMDQAETLWPCITKENPSGDPDISSDHSSTADALFFFENMQGTGIGKEKWQDADGDGKVDYGNLKLTASEIPKATISRTTRMVALSAHTSKWKPITRLNCSTITVPDASFTASCSERIPNGITTPNETTTINSHCGSTATPTMSTGTSTTLRKTVYSCLYPIIYPMSTTNH